MRYEEFIKRVKTISTTLNTNLEAEMATRATLETLAESLSTEESRKLAAQLPKGLQEYFQSNDNHDSKGYSLDEFYQQVSQRENVPPSLVVNHVSAVMSVFNSAISNGERTRILSQLPPEFDLLLSA